MQPNRMDGVVETRVPVRTGRQQLDLSPARDLTISTVGAPVPHLPLCGRTLFVTTSVLSHPTDLFLGVGRRASFTDFVYPCRCLCCRVHTHTLQGSSP